MSDQVSLMIDVACVNACGQQPFVFSVTFFILDNKKYAMGTLKFSDIVNRRCTKKAKIPKIASDCYPMNQGRSKWEFSWSAKHLERILCHIMLKLLYGGHKVKQA